MNLYKNHKSYHGVRTAKSRTYLPDYKRETSTTGQLPSEPILTMDGNPLDIQTQHDRSDRGIGPKSVQGRYGISDWTRERVQAVRKGIKVGELLTIEQEIMLTYLCIPYTAIRNDFSSEKAVAIIQQKINHRMLSMRNKGLL